MKSDKDIWCPDLSGYSGPKYRAIVAALEADIRSGALPPGARLPTQRDLAWALQINLSTVTEAFREAARQRLIAGEVGRGTYVLASSSESQLYALDRTARADVIDLSTNIPARAFRDDDVRDSFAQLLERENLSDLMDYHSKDLIGRCRASIAHFYLKRGFHPRQADIFPCAGAQAALYAALQMVIQPDMPILVEELTFPGMKVAARQLGLRLVPIAMDEEGICPGDLDRAVRASGAHILVISPILQNPSGAHMGKQRREEIVRLAEKLDLLVIEEDVYGGFAKEPPLSLQLAGRALLVGGLSKLVAPGVRFGYVISTLSQERASSKEATRIGVDFSPDEMVHMTSWMTAPVMLELACNWIESGKAEERMEWQKQEARARQILARRKLGLPPLGKASAAPHLWISAGGELGQSGDLMASQARAMGVEIVPASVFCAGRLQNDGVRLCITAPIDRASLSEACSRLNKVWRKTAP